MKPRSTVTKTLTDLYGTGHFNPRSFERRPGGSARRIYLWALAIFLLCAALAASLGIYLFAGTPDSFTGERVNLVLSGPTEVKLGAEENYTFRVQNNEDIDLAAASLFIGYAPAGDGAPGGRALWGEADSNLDTEAETTWQLGNIASGAAKDLPLKARFSGATGKKLPLLFTLRFRPKGFSSDYSLDLKREFALGESAIAFRIEAPAKVGVNSAVSVRVSIEAPSALASTVSEKLLTLSYPDTFVVAGNSKKWKVGDLPLAAGFYTLTLPGKIAAQSGDSIIIGAVLGNADNPDGAIKEEAVINVQSSQAALILEAVPGSGRKLQWDEPLKIKVTVTNSSGEILFSPVVSVSLAGDEWWRSESMQIQDNGIFEGGNVIWDAAATPKKLTRLDPGEIQTFQFNLTTRSLLPAEITGVPQITARAKLRARLNDQDVAVESDDLATKILANIEFDALGFYQSAGKLAGSGPHPPLPGQETNYVLVWQIGPTSSELKDLKASVTLPATLAWKNMTDYSLGELRYEAATRTVYWQASRVPKLTEPVLIRFLAGLNIKSEPANSLVILPQTDFTATDALANETLELYAAPVELGDVK